MLTEAPPSILEIISACRRRAPWVRGASSSGEHLRLPLSATLTSPMPVSQTRIRVRYAETDQMGVVYYANFFIWFEVGRVELLRQLGFHYKQMEIDDDCHIPVVEANCRYKSPARYDDELLLETSVLALRRSVIKFGYRLLRPEDDGSAPPCLPKAKPPTLPSTGRCTRCLCRKSMWPSCSNSSLPPPDLSLLPRICSLITPAGEMI